MLAFAAICNAQANTQLSNLASPTKVSQSLIPGGITGTKDLGSNTKRWRNGYFNATVYGYGVGSSYGVYGTAASYGVYGAGGSYGVYGTGTSYGVYGYSAGNYGVVGASGYIGTYGSGSSYGLYGSGGTYGAYANGSSYGIYGNSSSGYGASGVSSSSFGVYGSSGYLGVYGTGNSYGVYGSGGTYGTYGYTGVTGGHGVHAYSGNGNGLYAETGNNASYWAGYFVGDVFSSTGVYASSDLRVKQNVRDFTSAMDIINGLHPKQYEFRTDGNYKLMNFGHGTHFGLIAQDVEKLLPNLVKTSELKVPSVAKADSQESSKQQETAIKDFKSINYTEIIPILVKAMQELGKQNDDLKTQVATLTQTLSQITKSNSVVSVSSASINQNFPNPFTKSTVISFSVPQGSSANIIVNQTGSGKVIKTIPLSGGTSQLTFDGASLAAGAYSYSLYIDGKKIDTKQMIINR
ncbi:hypothetical protein BH10BAC2_BH10BAC2_29630 [soil metagenome]